MEQQPELLVVGKIVAAQGLRGELRVNPLSDFPERFTKAGPRWLRPPAQKSGPAAEPKVIQLVSGRRLPGKELFAIRLEGINDRSRAEACVGHELLVPSDERPQLAKGEFHLLDLVGLEVRLLESGTPIGHVQDLLHAGNDLLEVQLDGKKQTLWIPFVESIVPRVELQEGWIGITPPPGLLELAETKVEQGQS